MGAYGSPELLPVDGGGELVKCNSCGNEYYKTMAKCPQCGSFNVENCRYAGFWLRFVANLVDGVIITVISAVLEAILKDGILYAILLILPWLYYAGFESSESMATPGKILLNIKVVDLNGNRISFGRATARHFGKILSALILYIGFIMAGFTKRKQALHDIIAKCLVIKV
jgi:uncharacterized RDD family membrane protein YckC